MEVLQGTRLPFPPPKPNHKLTPAPTELALQTITLYHDLTPYLTPVHRALSTLYTRTYPILLPLANRLLVLAHDSPALLSVALLLLFLLVAMRIL
ncbi:hypothetical protein LCER1_G008303, partial [Lachnellula cervina]